MTFNFKYIYKQPLPIVIYRYPSKLTTRGNIECEFVFCTDNIPEIWVVIDLYSQLDPPRLSEYSIVDTSERNKNFIVDTMQQVSPGYYKYELLNAHILSAGKYKSNRVKIAEKLRDLQAWKYNKILNKDDVERIQNTILTDDSGEQCRDKVYIGFTPYAYDEVTNSNIPLDSTTFTEAIFNNCGPFLVYPRYGPSIGGTIHTITLKGNIALPPELRLLISDSYRSWKTVIYGSVRNARVEFILPTYTGNFQTSEERHLFYLEFLDKLEGLPKHRIRFVYVKE